MINIVMATRKQKMANTIFNVLKGASEYISMFKVDDTTGNVVSVIDSHEAEKFYVKPGKFIVSIVESDESDKIVVNLSDKVKFDDKIVKSLRKIANHYNYEFDVINVGKEITPKDFAFVHEAYNPMIGSKKKSIQKWNEAKLIIRHSKAVDEDSRGSRARNIKKMFIETINEERFLFPVNVLSGARAMAKHVGTGGIFYDKVGNTIVECSREIKSLKNINRYIYSNKKSLGENALEVRSILKGRIDEINSDFKKFLTREGYANITEEINNREEVIVEDLDDSVFSLRETLNLRIKEDDDLEDDLKAAAKVIKKHDDEHENPLFRGVATQQDFEDISDLDPDEMESSFKEEQELDDWFNQFSPEKVFVKEEEPEEEQEYCWDCANCGTANIGESECTECNHSEKEAKKIAEQEEFDKLAETIADKLILENDDISSFDLTEDQIDGIISYISDMFNETVSKPVIEQLNARKFDKKQDFKNDVTDDNEDIERADDEIEAEEFYDSVQMRNFINRLK